MAVDAMTNTKQDTERKRFIPNGVMCSACAWHQSEKCERKYSCVEMQAAYDQGWQARASQEPRKTVAQVAAEKGVTLAQVRPRLNWAGEEIKSAEPRPAGGELRDWLETQNFYELMQAYRNAPIHKQEEVTARYGDVKRAIAAFAASERGHEHGACKSCGSFINACGHSKMRVYHENIGAGMSQAHCSICAPPAEKGEGR